MNIDPGYWSDAKLVLASTKNFSHRIYIGRRIFAEITLRYHKGELGFFDWTYPDYKNELALNFFAKVRAIVCYEYSRHEFLSRFLVKMVKQDRIQIRRIRL